MICTHKDIQYSLTQTDRKTVSIHVEPDGNITVRAPRNIDLEKVDSIVELKLGWIYKAISEVEELNRKRVYRRLVDGEGYLYMGKTYRLRIEKNLDVPFSLTQGYFELEESQIESAKDLFINFYKEKGKEHITRRVEYFGKKIGVEPKNIRVMKLRNRWGSQSKTGLNFHWKIMLAPMTVIDYIIVHELAHLRRKDHSPQFWKIVESVIPDYDEKRSWLRSNGANLDI